MYWTIILTFTTQVHLISTSKSSHYLLLCMGVLYFEYAQCLVYLTNDKMLVILMHHECMAFPISFFPSNFGRQSVNLCTI